LKGLIKFHLLALAMLCAISTGYGQALEKKLELSLSTGHQQEDFHWDIAGNINGRNPNVLSELKCKKISGQDYSAILQWNIWRRFSLSGAYRRVNVRSGSVSDTDYAGDNRTQPTYQENFSDNKGSTTVWGAGAGYIIFNNNLFTLIPYAGYGINKQSLYIVDNSGRFPGLNSSYDTRWNGPFVKVSSSVKIWHALKLAADFTYNQVNYSAVGNWNLINEFQHPVSYRHAAKGYGIDASARLIYKINPNIGITLGYGYFNWQTGNGTDQLYLSSGQVDKTQLNGVWRSGYRVNGGLAFSL
jgi:hypothetical protein